MNKNKKKEKYDAPKVTVSIVELEQGIAAGSAIQPTGNTVEDVEGQGTSAYGTDVF